MKEVDHIISGFDSNAYNEAPFSVDFTTAKQLNRSGSTCDVYECNIQRRKVFVKRLKAEYRNNPLYRDAFNKEYDLGISLNHPSLPRYVGFGSDYIIMDFVEGDTLAELIKRNDRRLKNKTFVKQRLSELIDVAEYLHYRNIVHCDIKADNVIISPYPDRPAILIDFDKAYSPWLDSTHGNTRKYGCEECADGFIDFKGIGLIAEKLGLKQVSTACRRDDVSAESLRKALAGKYTYAAKPIIWVASIALIILTATIAGRWFIPTTTDNSTANTDSQIANADNGTAGRAASDTINEPTPVLFTATSAEATAAGEKHIDFDDIVKRHFGPLSKRHAYLRALAADPKATAQQLRIVFKTYAEDQLTAQNLIMRDAMKLYNFNDPLDVHPLCGLSREWKEFMTADAEINKLYSKEIEVRATKKLYEMGSKESQHSSDHLVSQPDTIPGVSRLSPHH